MPQPPAYTPATDFSQDEADNVSGRSTVRTAELDAEFSALATTIAAIRTNLSLNQRDDGEIRDARVKLHTLSTDVRALLASGNVEASNLRGDWVTATAYVQLDVVTQSGNTYICAIAHTSGTFATDLAADRWILLAQGATAASAIAFTPTSNIAASNVQAAIEESDTENRALSSAASALATALDTALRADLSSTSDAAKGDALAGVKRTSAGAVATTLHNWIERQQLDTYADFGIAPDGTTDRTSALTSLFSTLSGVSFRGWLRIPYNTKFNVATVYAAVPTGMMLDDESSINWGQPPTYKNKFRVMYSGDTVSDDTQQVIASGHHPALMLLNMGTAGTAAAGDRYASILHGVGKDADGDPMLGWLLQFAEEAAALKWRMSLRLQTPYAVAIANPQPWVTATIYAAGAYVTSDGGKVYRTTAGGTSGVTAPTGTGTGINDGGVLWDYVQAAINIDSTRFDWNEDGKSGQYAPAGGAARHTMSAGTRSMYLEIDDATDDFVIRDVSRSLDIFRVSTTAGLRPGMVQSMAITNNTISATGALQQVTPLHFLTASGGPWDITDITLPSGQTSGTITLWFASTNINLKNNANIVTRTGADIASAANMMVTLYKNTPTSGSWVVMNKN